VTIDSHGTEGDGKSHQIAVSSSTLSQSLEKLDGSKTVSLDILLSLKEMAIKNGVKLAIIDLSCHSGTSQVFGDDKTCVISSTGPRTYAFQDFAEKFSKNMVPGKNLEDIFLQTRKESLEPSFPMISTNVDKEISSKLYNLFDQFLSYRESSIHSDKIFDKIRNKVIGCETAKSDLNTLVKKIDELKTGLDLTELRNKLSEYAELQDSAIKDFKQFIHPELDKENVFKAEGSFGIVKSLEESKTLTSEEIINFPIEQYIAGLNNDIAKKKSDAFEIASNNALVLIAHKIADKQKQLKEQYPDYRVYMAKKEELLHKLDHSYILARNIAEQERKVYDTIYQNKKSHNRESRDFVL
jgi:hypothetical protein